MNFSSYQFSAVSCRVNGYARAVSCCWETVLCWLRHLGLFLLSSPTFIVFIKVDLHENIDWNFKILKDAMRPRLSISAIICASWLLICEAFYLPGLAPVTYCEKDEPGKCVVSLIFVLFKTCSFLEKDTKVSKGQSTKGLKGSMLILVTYLAVIIFIFTYAFPDSDEKFYRFQQRPFQNLFNIIFL